MPKVLKPCAAAIFRNVVPRARLATSIKATADIEKVKLGKLAVVLIDDRRRCRYEQRLWASTESMR
jgi:hypothetical protein